MKNSLPLVGNNHPVRPFPGQKHALAAATFAVLFSLPSYADQLKLEEVVVTAQKRSQSMQDVPVTVSVVDSDFLEGVNMNSALELQEYITSMQIFTNVNPFTASINLRGLGTAGNEPSLEPSVGLFVDGVFMSRSGMGLSDMMDIERIEVLFGPQGTLYGRNTNAGVLSVITKAPTDTFEASFEASAGNYDMTSLQGTVSGPITDSLRYRLAGKARKHDGYFDNKLLGTEVNDADDYSLRGQLEWDITDSFNARLTLSHINRDQTCCTGDVDIDSIGQPGTVPALLVQDIANGTDETGSGLGPLLANTLGAAVPDVPVTPTGPLDDYTIYADQDKTFSQESNLASLQLSWDIGNYTITSITAYDEYEWDAFEDVDGTNLTLTAALNDYNEGNSFAQELRIASAGGEFIDWQAGLYYYDNSMKRGLGKSNIVFGSTVPAYAGVALFSHPQLGYAALGGDPLFTLAMQVAATPGDTSFRDNEWNTESYSAFGQVVLNLSDDLALTLGARYNDEEKDASIHTWHEYALTSEEAGPLIGAQGALLNSFAPLIDQDYKLTEDNWSGMASLQWHMSDDIMLYATIANGYKSGGFNGAPGVTGLSAQYDPEHAINMEIGAKTTLWDGRARINIALYNTVLEDWQALSYDGQTGAFLINNAGEKEVSGVDFDATVLVTQNLTLIAKFSYLDAEFNEFETAQCETNDPRRIEGEAAALCDFTGERPWNAPEWSTSISGIYVYPIGDGEMYLQGDYSYTDYQNLSSKLARDTDEDSYRVNAFAGYRTDTWDVSAWGKNLTDEATVIAYSEAPALGDTRSAFMAAPRTYGITLRYNYF